MEEVLFQSKGMGLRTEPAINNSCSVFMFARNPKIRIPFEDVAALSFIQIWKYFKSKKVYSMYSIIS